MTQFDLLLKIPGTLDHHFISTCHLHIKFLFTVQVTVHTSSLWCCICQNKYGTQSNFILITSVSSSRSRSTSKVHLTINFAPFGRPMLGLQELKSCYTCSHPARSSYHHGEGASEAISHLFYQISHHKKSQISVRILSPT